MISSDPRTEGLIIQFASSGLTDLRRNAETFKAIARQYGIPMAISLVAETITVEMRGEFRDAGILLSGDTAATMRAFSWIYTRRRLKNRPRVSAPKPLPARSAPSDWAETMKCLEDCGIEPAKWAVLGPNDRAITACATFTYPLVVKVLPSESDHKTELGLVKLRVGSPDEVDAYAADFRKRLGKPDMGVLVQEMVSSGVEVVLSCLRKTDFGPVLSIGTGGVAVELYRDVTHLALPVSPAQVEMALKRLKLWTLLSGFRGKPAADIDSLVKAAARFSDIFLAMTDVQEFEINPLIVRQKGQGVVAVDALIATRK